MSNPLPLDELLSHRPLGRPLTPDGLRAEFELIRQAWEADGKTLPGPEDFRLIGRGSGTHLLKLVSPRASGSQAVLRFARGGDNSQTGLIPSVDAKKARVAKVVFRPLEVVGYPARHVIDHLLNADEISRQVLEAFVFVFGSASLQALRDGLAEPLRVERLPAAEFPIVFLPRPGGGDLQATPVSPVEAYVRMREVTDPFFQKRVVDSPPPRRGNWHYQHVSAKPQNISGAVGKRRVRFLASMPDRLDQGKAGLFRALLGGSFPRWRDDAVQDAVLAYANLLARSEEYSIAVLRAGLDRRADALIDGAQAFVEDTLAFAKEILEEVQERRPKATLPAAPPLADVILNRRWSADDGFNEARRALTSQHFRTRLSDRRA